MTEFTETALRHMCRNPKCRSKLATPVSNPREAFCGRGCHTSFHLHRCLVCEGPLVRKNETQKVCRKSKCRSTFRRYFDGGRYHAPSAVKDASKTLDSIGSKAAPAADRGIDWAIAVNSTRIRAPRRVLDAVFGRVPLSTDVPPM